MVSDGNSPLVYGIAPIEIILVSSSEILFKVIFTQVIMPTVVNTGFEIY